MTSDKWERGRNFVYVICAHACNHCGRSQIPEVFNRRLVKGVRQDADGVHVQGAARVSRGGVEEGRAVAEEGEGLRWKSARSGPNRPAEAIGGRGDFDLKKEI